MRLKLNNNKKILQIENLNISLQEKKLFSKPIENLIIKNLSLDIKEGEFVAIVGESSCGKTITALSIINLLPKEIKIKKGSINFLNNELTSFSKKEYQKILGKDISIIFQDPMTSLNPLKKVGPQIDEAILAHNKNTLSKILAKEKTLDLLSSIGFSNPKIIYNSFPHSLSGGMMQRILIAIALINEPKLLIADEPTTALDATVQAQIIDLIYKMNKKLNTALLLISHDLCVVSSICSKIYVMYAGEIIESGFTKDIIKNPLHPYTKALLQTIPDLKNKEKKLTTISGTVPSIKERKNFKCNFYDRCSFRQIKKINNICNSQEPKLIEIEKNHFVRCNFYNCKNQN